MTASMTPNAEQGSSSAEPMCRKPVSVTWPTSGRFILNCFVAFLIAPRKDGRVLPHYQLPTDLIGQSTFSPTNGANLRAILLRQQGRSLTHNLTLTSPTPNQPPDMKPLTMSIDSGHTESHLQIGEFHGIITLDSTC